MRLVHNGDEFYDVIGEAAERLLELDGLLDECVPVHTVIVLHRQAGHFDNGTDGSVNILACQQTGSVGGEFRHPLPIQQAIVYRLSKGADYRNLA